MKIIMLEDVPNVGRKYEVVTVKDGLAQNKLIPQKKAIFASQEALSSLERQRQEAEIERQARERELTATLEEIDGKTITVRAKASEKGSLFSGITSEHISTAIKDQLGAHVPVGAITLSEPIKEAGEHTIGISGGEASAGASVTLSIEKE